MKQFQYTITDPVGIHARPAGLLVKAAKGFQSTITVGYIWVETIAYVVCAALIFFFTVEKKLPEEQAAIAQRHKQSEN